LGETADRADIFPVGSFAVDLAEQTDLDHGRIVPPAANLAT
jgi:hypothetical protein